MTRPEKTCQKCKRPHPGDWGVPFTLGPFMPGVREAQKANFICSWCFRDYKGRRRPMDDEWAAGRLLHSLATIPSIDGSRIT